MIIQVLLIGVFLYFLLVAYLYWRQESYIFFPAILPQDYSFPEFENFKEEFFDTPDGARIHALHFFVEDPKGVVLYFHGNTGALTRWGHAAIDLVDLGYEVLMPDYRGYGKSTGRLTEKALHADARLLYTHLTEKWEENEIVLFGRSLGTGIATQLAVNHQPKLLILETPYTSIPAVSHAKLPFLPVKKLLRYRLSTAKIIQEVMCPVVIFHGTNDELIPYEQAVRLTKILGRPATLITIEGGMHNNLGEFKEFHEGLRRVLK